MAQRPTPKPFRGECPFCDVRLVSAVSSCSNCKREFNTSDISIIREMIALDSSLRDPERAHELGSKIHQHRLLASEEAERAELELARVRAEDEDKKVAALADARAKKIARFESMPRWKQVCLSKTGKIIGSSFLVIFLLLLVVFTDSQKPSANLQTDATPTQAASAIAVESPTALSKAELQSLETQTQADLNMAQIAFCTKVESLGLSKIKSLDPGQGEPPEFLVLEDLYRTVAKIESKYNFNTGKQLMNDLGPYWGQWSISFTTISYLGDYKQDQLNDSVNLYNFCRSNSS